MIRTRFAPSPTGFLHIGGARTALFAWAYAKKHNGKFILRIEDTDLERSTQESVDSIIDAMHWLGLDYDEGPFYQTKRMERYKKVINQLLEKKQAYHCYCSKAELDQMREGQKARGLKPKYDRRCLLNNIVKPDIKPVVRFKNPDSGSVIWQDLVKGQIEISNNELDDLIIARSDGSPTYNLCVVVDDLDMQITHVIRGDDHINNTPRQINILQALNATLPFYAHVPMILRADGQKMSKRIDAVSVMDYEKQGILPEALLNYLARLCWSHGDDEIFTLEQFVSWFDLNNISPSAARFDETKLLWVNEQHIKNIDIYKLVDLTREHFKPLGLDLAPPQEIEPVDVIALAKGRVNNLNDMYSMCRYFYQPTPIPQDVRERVLTPESLNILSNFADEIEQFKGDWNLDNIKQLIKKFCEKYNLKMPQLGMPLRLKLCGYNTATPPFDAIIYVLGRNYRKIVVNRIRS